MNNPSFTVKGTGNVIDLIIIHRDIVDFFYTFENVRTLSQLNPS